MASFDNTFGSSTTTGGTGSSGSFRALTAFFDSRDDAQEAVSELRTLGLPEASIRMVGNDSSTSASSTSTSYGSSTYRDEHKGFWDSLADFFFPDDDRATYAEGLRRGGYLVTVSNIPDDLYDRALDILDDEGSVDVDSRADQWRSEGWTGSSSYAGGSSSDSTSSYGSGGTLGMGAAATGAGLTGTDRSYDADAGASRFTSGSGSSMETDRRFSSDRTAETSLTGASSTGSAFSGTSDATMRGDSETIPVVEENLRIGKRDVNLGRVRVRSYMVEEPVSEQVNLRDERVTIERHPVDRALSGNETAFTDRVIEAEEHAEEAMIDKQARVKEEISLRKEAEERTETVSDTVRHTEIEVEDERTGNRLSSDVRVNEDRNR